jgi:hypothetical protein
MCDGAKLGYKPKRNGNSRRNDDFKQSDHRESSL